MPLRRKDTEYSKFWMGDDEFSFDPKDISLWDAESLIKLASFKRAIANFVRIVTGKSIQVMYNTGEQSFAGGDGDTKVVVLSAKLEHNQFDTAVGLALHEGSHCALTDAKLHRFMLTYQRILSEMVVKNIPITQSEVEKKLDYEYRYNKNDDDVEKYLPLLKTLDHQFIASVISRMYAVMHIDVLTEHLGESMLWDRTKWFENWVEDRRIDHWQAKTSPGYRGYYNAMYETYFYTKLVGRAVAAKNYARHETWESYRFRITNILHPNTDLDALKGLREIWDTIDLKNIERLNSVLDSWMLSYRIIDTIYKYIDPDFDANSNGKNEKSPGKQPSNQNGKREVAEHQYEDEVDDTEPTDDDEQPKDGNPVDDNQTGDDNYDSGTGLGGEKKEEEKEEKSDKTDGADTEGGEKKEESDASDLTPAQVSSMEKEEDRQGKFLNGDTSKKKMSKKVKNALNAIENAGVSLEGVGRGIMDGSGKPVKIQCVVVRNVTRELIESGTFDHMFMRPGDYYDDSATNQKAVDEGFRIGTMLGKRLQIRNEARTTRYSRLETGRIDKRLLASLGYQNNHVFYRTSVDKFNPIMLHISVDASGSMHGMKWRDTLTTVVAIIKAASMTQNLNVVVSVRGTTEGTSGGRTISRRRRGRAVEETAGYEISVRPLVAIVYDSRVDKLSKVMSLFKYITARGSTPEGLAFEPIIDEMVTGKKGEIESIFVNLSDGQPAFGTRIYDGSQGGFLEHISYSDEVGGKHTASMVQKMRSLNIKVLSYIISDGSWGEDRDWTIFKMCYGKDSRKIDTKNILELARTLNEKFLSKE